MKKNAPKLYVVYATKTRETKPNGWLPKKVALVLDVGQRIVSCAGWTANLGDGTKLPKARLNTRVMEILQHEWADLFGRSWKLEIA